jgi:hypothetical protein
MNNWTQLIKSTYILRENKQIVAQVVPTTRVSDTYKVMITYPIIGQVSLGYIRGLAKAKDMAERALAFAT